MLSIDDKVQGGQHELKEEDTGVRWSRKWRSGCRMDHPCGQCSPRSGEGLGAPDAQALGEWLPIVGRHVEGFPGVGKY